MAIRLRKIPTERCPSGHWVALCAVESDPKVGDVYLDDAQDSALRRKFEGDYQSEGVSIAGGYDPLALGEKVRDAQEEHAKWQAGLRKPCSGEEGVLAEGFKIVYCALCRTVALVCPHCKNLSCSGMGCEKCREVFSHVEANLPEVGDWPDGIPVIGQIMHRLLDDEW